MNVIDSCVKPAAIREEAETAVFFACEFGLQLSKSEGGKSSTLFG